ncbi:hypothetical protein N7466_006098 [Penicillium verhagenii]|uniref:uncharacterized protein n=1 Tax=Penicillium verhagenii TaxID=1562060 RepID=UPI00254504C0|nr:uncharacterized protein N7466_006098 [Penicillium verhagenii]KAJ5930605.1 hypothetical protein N7466_006098 [Penicillium verhagenii]
MGLAKVFVPLYIYPSPGAWSPLEDVISTHPNLNFTIVINPGNGPGPDDLPDSHYTRAIPRLASYANVRLLGYVHTSYTTRNAAAVYRDIKTYAEWPNKSGNPDLAVRGIFFDETPQQYSVHSLAYLQNLTQLTKDLKALGSNPYYQELQKANASVIDQVVHNPGAVPDSRYLATADSTVVFEETYGTFQERHRANMLMPLGDKDRSQRAALIHSVPDSVEGSELRHLVKTVRMVADEVFITHLSTDYYASFGSKWAEFVDLI